MARQSNPTLQGRPDLGRPPVPERERVRDRATTDLVSLTLAWGSWAWASFFIVLGLFFVEFHDGQTLYARDGVGAIVASAIVIALLTAACVAMTMPRWRRATPVLAALAVCVVVTALFTLGLFLVPAAFGFAMAAVFEVVAARDTT